MDGQSEGGRLVCFPSEVEVTFLLEPVIQERSQQRGRGVARCGIRDGCQAPRSERHLVKDVGLELGTLWKLPNVHEPGRIWLRRNLFFTQPMNRRDYVLLDGHRPDNVGP